MLLGGRPAVVVVAREHVQLATMLLKREGELAYEIGAIEEGVATEPEALRAVGWVPSVAGLRRLRRELLSYLRAALVEDRR